MSKASDSTSSDPSPKFRARQKAEKEAQNAPEKAAKTRRTRGRKKHAHGSGEAQRAALSAAAVAAVHGLQEALLGWYARARRDLPWRRTRDPYAIWLSEVMLQQTRVATVLDYYPKFLSAYPTVRHLAKASLEDVLGAWSGLGYYRRARALHAGAREVVEKYGGKLPREAAELCRIASIGPYTAGAIASIAFGASEPLVAGNVARVLSPLFALP